MKAIHHSSGCHADSKQSSHPGGLQLILECFFEGAQLLQGSFEGLCWCYAKADPSKQVALHFLQVNT